MKPTYAEQIGAEITRSRKLRDSARLFYYTEALKYSAVAGWDTFRKSWAGEQWLARNADKINAFRAEQNSRFGHMGVWR